MSNVRFRTSALSGALCVVGAILSTLALYEYTVVAAGLSTGPSFCDINETVSCAAVNASGYSTFLGIPVASYGLFFYIAMAVVYFTRCLGVAEPEPEWRRSLPGFLSAVAVVLSIVLFAISKFLIGALCIMCIGMYIVNLLLFLFAVMEARAEGGGIFARWISAPIDAVATLAGGRGAVRDHVEIRVVTAAVVAAAAFIAFVPKGIMIPMAKRKLFLSRATPTGDWNAERAVKIPLREGGALETDYSHGPDDAPVQIVEFLDFECPACRRFYVVVKDLEKKYDGKIRVTLKNFPLDQECNPNMERPAHKFACLAAQFARCSGEQGAYWKVVDTVMRTELFEGERSHMQVKSDFLSLATGAGLDGVALEECLGDARQRSRLVEDIKDGLKLGVEGTPAVWLNGKRVRQPVDNVPLIVEEVLKGARK